MVLLAIEFPNLRCRYCHYYKITYVGMKKKEEREMIKKGVVREEEEDGSREGRCVVRRRDGGV